MKKMICSIAVFACLAGGSLLGVTANATAEGSTNWSGFYAGAAIGHSIVDLGFDTSAASRIGSDYVYNIDNDADGFAGGVHAGYNVQSGNFVFGIEGDYTATTSDISADLGRYPAPTASTASLTSVEKTDKRAPRYGSYRVELESLASVKGRIGYTTNNLLLFLTGGVAWAELDLERGYRDDKYKGKRASSDETLTGFVIGAGGEYMLANGFSLRGDVLHYEFDDNNVDLDSTVVRTGFSIHLN